MNQTCFSWTAKQKKTQNEKILQHKFEYERIKGKIFFVLCVIFLVGGRGGRNYNNNKNNGNQQSPIFERIHILYYIHIVNYSHLKG